MAKPDDLDALAVSDRFRLFGFTRREDYLAYLWVLRALDRLRAAHVAQAHTDDFVVDQISIDDRPVFACVQAIADSRNQRPETVDDVLGQLERAGLVESAAALRTN